MSLINESNQQYYRGNQTFFADGTKVSFTATFDTNLVSGSVTDPGNFTLYTKYYSGPWAVVPVIDYSVSGNTITFNTAPVAGTTLAIQLDRQDGGDYGVDENSKSYGNATEDNYGSYEYIKLNDVINNFIVGYVGTGKLIPSVKRTDVVFHAKRGLQEFSYDTLKSIKSQELTVPNSLSIVIPQDYVNYVKMSWVDKAGVKHIIYPTTLTSNPTQTPVQDSSGIPTQDEYSKNLQGDSITEERWDTNDIGSLNRELQEESPFWNNIYGGSFDGAGEFYGIQPEVAQINGWFTINKRENKFSFSNDLVDRVIILEYISDGLAYDTDTKLPKMAEEAMYAHLSYSILAGRANQPEYVVRRLKQDRSAKLRNAKIRLSDIKLSEIAQVMRGKSKHIKH